MPYYSYDSDWEDYNSVTVFTDGACSNNGRHGARAGIGVFFGENHPDNVSHRLEGPQTNQRAEIEAARVGIMIAANNGYHHVTVVTDSQFLIDSMTKWIHEWLFNGWKTYYGDEVMNRVDFENLLDQMDRIDVTWKKVSAHSNIYGNVQADLLARNSLNEIIAYTYACSGRGEIGVCVYWPNGEIPDLYAPLGGGGGRTVQRGDIVAARNAMEMARDNGFRRILVKTNSQNLIDAVFNWVPRWQRNGWTSASGAQVKNRNDFLKLLRVMQDIEVGFIKDTDYEAVQLARSVL